MYRVCRPSFSSSLKLNTVLLKLFSKFFDQHPQFILRRKSKAEQAISADLTIVASESSFDAKQRPLSENPLVFPHIEQNAKDFKFNNTLRMIWFSLNILLMYQVSFI